MKALNAATLFALIGMGLAAPAPAREYPSEYSRKYLEARLSRFKSMRTTGLVLGIAGVGLVVLGSVLVGTAEYETHTDWNGNTSRITHDPQWPVGFLSIVGGVPLTITGGILAGIGSSKTTFYQRRLQDFSLQYHLNPGRTAVALALTF